MSHLGVDVVDFLLIAVYPVVGIFVIEMISRVIKFPRWIKLVIQGFVSLGFAIAYVTLITPHGFTSLVLAVLAIALFYQARRAKIDPSKSIY